MLSNLKKRLALAKDDKEIAYLEERIAHKLSLPKYAHLAKVAVKSTPKAKGKK
jgi:hypothetical protein